MISESLQNTSVLVVEDEEIMRNILRKLLIQRGADVFTADSAEAALSVFSSNVVDVTLTDIKMAGRDGIELLDTIKSLDPEAVVIIMTAFSSVDTAIAALRKGAYDYITKPFVNDDLLKTIENAATQRKLFNENRLLRREVRHRYNFDEMIGESPRMRELFTLIGKVANTPANILIQGESGTGKELVARSIHFNSDRAGGQFLAVNCGALPGSLLESELFGHVKGAFTDAVADKKGLFRSASGGTLFLDEIGEMPLPLQVKLLRALQEHVVTPVGSSEPIPFDARIIAATNRDLETEVAEGRFREDLFYRLNVVEINVPPLRERDGDITLLARHFASATARRHDAPTKPISKPAIEAISSYSWPGNVRELEHVIERAMILSEAEITPADLPAKLNAETAKPASVSQPTLDQVEMDYVLSVLSEKENDKAAAAKILGIDLSTLYRKLKRYEVENISSM